MERHEIQYPAPDGRGWIAYDHSASQTWITLSARIQAFRRKYPEYIDTYRIVILRSDPDAES